MALRLPGFSVLARKKEGKRFTRYIYIHVLYKYIKIVFLGPKYSPLYKTFVPTQLGFNQLRRGEPRGGAV